jgi:hypothetical protein
MKVRNLPFNDLNDEEKKIVINHFNSCMQDDDMECGVIHSDIDDFWECHREEDTDDGNYEGWIE